MKNKILLFIMLLAVCIIPMGVNAKDLNVTLKSIAFVEKGGNATQVIDPSIDGYNINLNMKFEKLNDYITYKLVIENKDNEDYYLVLDVSDEYVKYDLSTISIKKNATTEVQITAKYTKELPAELKDQQLNKVVKLNITDKKGNVLNPKTGQSIYLIIALLLVIGATILVVLKKKQKKNVGLIVLAILLVPVSVLAANDLSITINSTYEIKDISGLLYKGKKLNIEEAMTAMKTEFENRCLNDNTEKSVEIDIPNFYMKVIFEPTSEYSADVNVIYPSVEDNIDLQTHVIIETDAETGDSRLVVGECTMNSEAPFANYTFNGDKLISSTRVRDFAQNEGCPSLTRALEEFDTECVIKLI